MRRYKTITHIIFLMISTVTMSLAGCGDGSGDDSSRVSGVSTGGTGNSISPGLGGGGDTNPALNTNANNGIVVNSATQPPLLATEASLSIYPLRLVQNQESVKFYANTAPTVVKYTLASNLKAEGILPTVDGAMVLFSTPSQTGYQVISFDGVGTPLASKVYGVDGKLMAIRHQQSSNNSYFIDLLLNDDHSTSSKPYSHQRFKVVDGVMTSGKKTLDLNQKIIAAVSNNNYMIWIGQDSAQAYWLNAIQCTSNTTTCTQLVPVKLEGTVTETTESPRSVATQLKLVGDDIQLTMTLSGQIVTKTFGIVAPNVVIRP